MSVPRPAMLVAMVTVPGPPAWATICASLSWCLAFSTECRTFSSPSRRDKYSETSMDTVPTSTGCERACRSLMSAMMARNFSAAVR